MRIFIEPPPDAQRKERQGTGKEKGRERGISRTASDLEVVSMKSDIGQ
jgi:hypothetical protein